MYKNPYESLADSGLCQRANFHTHAGTGPGTCGSISVDDVLNEYQMLSYGAVCISNHNLYTEPKTYRTKYNMCLIEGYEYTMGHTHMVCAGTKTVILDSPQKAIDETAKEGGFTILCHPNWEWEWSFPKDVIDSIHGFAGIEIYNGSIDCGAVRTESESNGRCNAPNVYDYLLSSGRLCWCFGNDDFHRWWYMAIAWNMIYSGREKNEIIESVKKGAFYVSTGLMLECMTLRNNVIYIRVRNNEGYRDIYSYSFIGRDGVVLKTVKGSDATYEVNGSEMYVRVEVMSSSGKMLYTQPVYDDTKFTPEVEL